MAQHQRRRLYNPLLSDVAFWVLLTLVGLALLVSTILHHHTQIQKIDGGLHESLSSPAHPASQEEEARAPHLFPRLPYLPEFPTIENADQLVHRTLYEGKPTIAGIAAILYNFLNEMKSSNQQLAQSKKADLKQIRSAYFHLAQKHLVPLDAAYRGRPVFPIRDDDSIFVSVAAFREHLLADTLQSLFGSAAHPEKLFVGVVVNNCFDDSPRHHQCKGGVRVVPGKKHPKTGKDLLEPLMDGVPDPNHIVTFCQNATFQPYCNSGQVRVLYVGETEALGPATARYYSSKLWGGETYYVQIDSHLLLAQRWDELYVQDLHLCRNYPKAVLSTYPPGFVNFRPEPPFTPGTRLCRCQLRGAEGFLPRVEMEGRCKEDEVRPTQMPFLGAGFFFAHANILVDVPFDPFLPWLFMGEEIALSIRAWTSGWNIYAPRKNWIGHQYRPLSMGTPHYQQSVGNFFHRPALVSRAQGQIQNRIKHMMGYPHTLNGGDGSSSIDEEVLAEAEHFGLGKERTKEEYLQFAEIDLDQMTCGSLKWCSEGLLE